MMHSTASHTANRTATHTATHTATRTATHTFCRGNDASWGQTEGHRRGKEGETGSEGERDRGNARARETDRMQVREGRAIR